MPATRSSIPRPPADVLRSLYVSEQLGCPEIGKIYGRDASTIRSWLLAAGIPTRSRGSDRRQHFVPGQRSAFAGRSHSPESRAKIGAASAGRDWARGDDHWLRRLPKESNPNWKGGATPERQEFNRSPEWSAAVRCVWARDGACCRNCGKAWRVVRGTEPTFHVHHVWSFQIRATRADPALMVLLCRACHLWVHSKANVTRAWLPQEPDSTHLPGLAELQGVAPLDVDAWVASARRGRAAYLCRAAEREASMPTLFDLDALDAEQTEAA